MISVMDTDTETFAAMIADLQLCGLKIIEIADAVGTTQPCISRIKNGQTSEPLYFLGARIVQLHRKEMMKMRRKKKRN